MPRCRSENVICDSSTSLNYGANYASQSHEANYASQSHEANYASQSHERRRNSSHADLQKMVVRRDSCENSKDVLHEQSNERQQQQDRHGESRIGESNSSLKSAANGREWRRKNATRRDGENSNERSPESAFENEMVFKRVLRDEVGENSNERSPESVFENEMVLKRVLRDEVAAAVRQLVAEGQALLESKRLRSLD